MYRRLEFALNEAVDAFRSKARYVIIVYTVLATSGSILSVHFVVNNLYDNVLTSIVIGWCIGVFLGAMPIGFLLISLLLSTFIYKFIVWPDCGAEANEIEIVSWDRGFRIVVSVVVNIAILGTVLNFIDDGVRGIPVVGEQYTFLLDWSPTS